MLLNGKCSWSYKSLKADDKIKKDERNTSLCATSPNSSLASLSENSTEVYNFEVVLDKKKTSDKICKKNYLELLEMEKDCYEYNEVSLNKKTKKRKKPTKNNKNIQNSQESPKITSRSLRNKKRINYADSNEEFDWNLDESGTTPMVIRITHTNQNNISRDSEYSDDEGLIFQTRYSDKNTNVMEIANTIESNSSDIFENLEERKKTTTSPMILKLNENLTSQPSKQNFSDNQIISFVDSPQINKALEKSENQSNSQSESEDDFNYSPEIGNAETNRESLTPEEFNINIDIGAEIFEKCQKVCSEINTKCADFKLEKLKKEIIFRDIKRTEENATSESYQSKKVNENNLTTENTWEINGHFDKNDEILPKNRKTIDLKNKFIKRKPNNQMYGIQADSSNSDFNEERLKSKIMKKGKQSDFNSETTRDNDKMETIENNLGQNTETKESMPVQDFIEWQSSNEEGNQNTLKKEMLFKKMESNLNWNKTLNIQKDCNISPSSFNLKETRLENFSEKSLSIDNDILETNSSTLKYYFENSSSNRAESDTISENDGKIYSFQNQRFKNTNDISSEKDSISVFEDENYDFMSKRREPIISTNHQTFSKKKNSNHKSKCKQVNEIKKVRKEKIIEETQEDNQKISIFNASKDLDFTKQTFKNKSSCENKPKTWEDLETKLLSETHDFCKISPNLYQETEKRENIWSEKKEFEIQKITKGVLQTTSKETERNTGLNNSDVLPITDSTNLNIINKAIQAMKKCTSTYVSPFKNDFNSNSQEYEGNDDLNDYSISVHSTIIHSSKNKLRATNTFFRRTGKINTNIKKGKRNLKNKIVENNLIEKKLKTPTKRNLQKEKKVAKISKQPKTYTEQNNMQIMEDLRKFEEENLSDNSQNFIFDIEKNNHSNMENICTLYNPTIFSEENNSDKSEQNFHLKETDIKSRYSFRKRKIKPTLENQSKKLKTVSISAGVDLQNVCNGDNASHGSDLNNLNKAQTNAKIILKNNLSKINLDKKLKSKDDVDAGSVSNFSFNYTDEIMGLCDLLDTKSNAKRKPEKVKSLEKKQDTNLNIPCSSSNLEAKETFESNHKKNMDVNILKGKNDTNIIKENKCTTINDFNYMETKDKRKNKLIKKDTKKKYKEYLKKLFQAEDALNDGNEENGKDDSIKQIQKEKNGTIKELNLMMKEEDELFSISSEDSEVDEKGIFSEVNLTQNSGLFFDVLDEKDN